MKMPSGEIWPDEPEKAAQKDTEARWTLKIGGKQPLLEDGTPLPLIALPVFSDKTPTSSTGGSASSVLRP